MGAGRCEGHVLQYFSAFRDSLYCGCSVSDKNERRAKDGANDNSYVYFFTIFMPRNQSDASIPNLAHHHN